MGISIVAGQEVISADVANIDVALVVPKLDLKINSLSSGPNTRIITGVVSGTPGNYLTLSNVPSGAWKFDWQCMVGSGSAQAANVDINITFSLLKNAAVINTFNLFIEANLGQEVAPDFFISPVTLPINGGGIESSNGTDDFHLSWTRASSAWVVNNGYMSAFRIGTL